MCICSSLIKLDTADQIVDNDVDKRLILEDRIRVIALVSK